MGIKFVNAVEAVYYVSFCSGADFIVSSRIVCNFNHNVVYATDSYGIGVMCVTFRVVIVGVTACISQMYYIAHV